MDGLRDYLLSVTAAAILCSLIKNLLPGKTAATQLIHVLCGVFLAFSLISPVLQLDPEQLFLSDGSFAADAQAAASMGEKEAADALCAVIKERTEAYILDKATGMDVSVEVEITLQDLIPSGVILRGAVSPYVRSTLSEWITQQLGIPKEAQEWIGQP